MAYYLVDDSWVSILGAGCPLQVFSLIATYCQAKGECDLTQEQIAERTGYKPRWVKDALKELREKGLVERVKNGVWKVQKMHLLEITKSVLNAPKKCRKCTSHTLEYTNISNNNREARAREEFVEPSLEEVLKFATDHRKGTKEDATDFHNYYTSCGWMVGKKKMQNWQSSYCLWVGRKKQFVETQPKAVQQPNTIVADFRRQQAARRASQAPAEKEPTPEEREQVRKMQQSFMHTFDNVPSLKRYRHG